MNNINLKDIILKLKYVNFKHDTSGRTVSLHKILNLDKEERHKLFFIEDFEDRKFNYIHRVDLKSTQVEFEKKADHVGYIYWYNTSKEGVFYEAVFETEDQDYFNAIKQQYFKKTKLNKD